jgi:hypothetical protein
MRCVFAGALRRALVSFATTLLGCSLVSAATSSWVFYDANGVLQYHSDSRGNRIMDFSSAGYGGGGVALPQVAAKVTVSPSGGDDTTAIQAAINQVAAMAPDANGFRGAVLLKPGTFHTSATLTITTSGVVLAGSGSGDGGTIVNMTGGGFLFLRITGSGGYTKSGTVAMTDSYVPSGTTTFNVASTSGFSVGDTIIIDRPVTSAWVHLMGMDTLTRSGSPQTWISVGTLIQTDRVIKAISGTQITLDVPLTDSFDSTYLNPPGGTVSTYTFSGRITNCGVEHLKIVGAPSEQTGSLYQALSMNSVMNAWASDVVAQDTENSVSVDRNSKQVTVNDVRIVHTYAQTNSAAPADFALNATQVLAVNCYVTGKGNTWPYIASGPSTGPGVILDCFADDRGVAPHQRWSTGLLADLCNFPSTYTADKTGVGFSNRGDFGSGQGWDAGWSVAWNVTTQTLLIQLPPGANNWGIGCTGTILSEAAPGSSTILPNGTFDSPGVAVTPGSLYLAQLKQRLGQQALTNIGYADTNGTALPVAAPTFTPAAGTYSTTQTVAIASATAGAAIRYTTNGTTPTSTSGTLYTGPITVSASETVKAIAYEGGLSDSAVSTAAYTISAEVPAAPPTFNPGGGTFNNATSVTMNSITSGATIRYTTDGSTPTETNGTIYSGPVTVGATTTLKAIAYAAGFLDSSVTTATYTLQVAPPAFSPPAGTYNGTQSVTITTATTGASIRYTTDGSTPTVTTGTLYAGPISVSATTTLKAIAYKTGYTSSSVVSSAYTINPGTATYTSANGFVNIPLSSAQSGTFTAQFDAAVSLSPSNVTLGLCSGAQTAYTGLACVVRFNPSGDIDARNGGAYAAASTIPFSANVNYHFRLVVNVPAHTYSAYVTPAGGAETLIGSNYAFRTEQAGVTSLDTFNVDVSATPGGSVTVGAVALTTPVTVAMEAESLTRTSSGATTTLQTDANTSGGQWISLDATGTGQYVEFTTTSLPAGTYSVQMAYKTNNNRGILSLKVDGTQVGTTLDQYASPSTYPTKTFGTVTFASTGAHLVRLTVTGKNAASSSYTLSADKFTFVGQ